MASVTDIPPRSLRLSAFIFTASVKSRGDSPSSRRKVRCKWNGLAPVAAASRASVTGSSAFDSRVHAAIARSTSEREPPSSGWQRRHGLNPALRASAGVAKNSTRSGRGRRLGHEGLQKIPVDRTAYTNCPSALRSRCATACHRASSVLASALLAVVLPEVGASFSLSAYVMLLLLPDRG